MWDIEMPFQQFFIYCCLINVKRCHSDIQTLSLTPFPQFSNFLKKHVHVSQTVFLWPFSPYVNQWSRFVSEIHDQHAFLCFRYACFSYTFTVWNKSNILDVHVCNNGNVHIYLMQSLYDLYPVLMDFENVKFMWYLY